MRTNTGINPKNSRMKRLLGVLGTLFLVNSSVIAQTAAATESTGSSVLSNPLFILFAFIIVFLLVIIIVLSDVVKGSAKIMMDKKKQIGKAACMVILLLLSSTVASAQTAEPIAATTYGGLSATMFYTLSVVVAFEIFIIIFLISFVRSFLGISDMKSEERAVQAESKVQAPSLIEKFNASVAVEDEADILQDHNYDGIQELDNNLPPWWKYGFYLTIVFAGIYLINYHVLKTGDLQGAEYTKEMAQAAADIAEFQKNSALSVDENTVTVLSDKESLSKGQEIYMNNCLACHGKFGEGQVGPNFTDDYWIHGGKINDIFKTIKYGFPDKGMKSWKEDLSPMQISCVASYIKSLRGTNPANQKEKQGELYVESTATDTTAKAATPTDTLKVAVDTVKKANN